MRKFSVLYVVLGCASINMVQAAGVDQARLLAADADTGNWMTYGRTFSEQRYVPLDQINADTVSKLGLV